MRGREAQHLEVIFLIAPAQFKGTSLFDIYAVSALCMKGSAYFIMLPLTVTLMNPFH